MCRSLSNYSCLVLYDHSDMLQSLLLSVQFWHTVSGFILDMMVVMMVMTIMMMLIMMLMMIIVW